MADEILFELNLSPALPVDIKDVACEQGENEDIKCELVEQLRNLIFEKGDFEAHRTDDEYLIKFLRARYWNIEQTYKLLYNYYSFRKDNKILHDNVRCVDLMSLAEQEILTVTPYREQNGRRIMILRFGTWDPKKMPIDDILRLTLIILELGSMEPISQVAGGIGLFDLGGLTMSQVLHLTPSIAQKIIALIVTSSPLRTAAIHIVNQNWIFSAILKVFKPLLNAKMREKLFIHGSDMSSLHSHIGPKYLPKRYIVNQNWIFSAILKVFKPLLNAKMREKLFIHGSDMSSLHSHIGPKYLPKRYGGIKEDSSFQLSLWTEALRADDKVKWELQKLGYNISENL